MPFDVKAGNNQPIWVDLLVPRTTAAGHYSGTYTVTSNQVVLTERSPPHPSSTPPADGLEFQLRL